MFALDEDEFGVHIDPEPPGGWAQVPRALRAELKRHRFRFRFAHELAHTFFFWRDGQRPRLHIAPDARQEHFCDVFARALLVPPAGAGGARPDAHGVVALHRIYDVSLEVAGRAFAAAHAQKSVAIWYAAGGGGEAFLQWSNRTTPPTVDPAWRSVRRTSPQTAWLPERRQLIWVSA
jgi:hypothetical protein